MPNEHGLEFSFRNFRYIEVYGRVKLVIEVLLLYNYWVPHIVGFITMSV